MDCWRQWIRHRTANVNEKWYDARGTRWRSDSRPDDRSRTTGETPSEMDSPGQRRFHLPHELVRTARPPRRIFSSRRRTLQRAARSGGRPREQAR